mmetsp:Transcript_44461/g.141545  ORF Transcript_44461/g.141545 Transcript_44461/m.141545 type:complete len:201 (-) Transcript_44461:304-906(-)
MRSTLKATLNESVREKLSKRQTRQRHSASLMIAIRWELSWEKAQLTTSPCTPEVRVRSRSSVPGLRSATCAWSLCGLSHTTRNFRLGEMVTESVSFTEEWTSLKRIGGLSSALYVATTRPRVKARVCSATNTDESRPPWNANPMSGARRGMLSTSMLVPILGCRTPLGCLALVLVRREGYAARDKIRLRENRCSRCSRCS